MSDSPAAPEFPVIQPEVRSLPPGLYQVPAFILTIAEPVPEAPKSPSPAPAEPVPAAAPGESLESFSRAAEGPPYGDVAPD